MIDISDFIKGALALSIALSWNMAIRSMIEYSYPNDPRAALIGQFAYAITIVILAILFVIVYNIVYEHRYPAECRQKILARNSKINGFADKYGHFRHPL